MILPSPSLWARETMRGLLIAATAVAMVHLPEEALPAGWLLAFLLPGATLGILRGRLHRPWHRATVAVLLQTLACWLALVIAGPMSRPAALACTILPPLGYALGRNQEMDQWLALFLSFCVLLVGVILVGAVPGVVAAYAVIACIALRAGSHLGATSAAVAVRSPAKRATILPALAGLPSIVLATLLATLMANHLLGLLPSPTGAGVRSTAPATTRRAGLDDAFELDGSRGVLSDLTGEQLVRVSSADRPLPTNLYLRSGFFVVPGLDRWQLGPLDLVDGGGRDQRLRSPLPRAERFELAFERYAGARNFVFLPPATFAIDGLQRLRLDLRREWVRRVEGVPPTSYRASFQVLPPPPDDLPVDPNGARFGLLRLPDGLRREPFLELLERWQVGDAPLAAMAAIERGLAAHCRYDRIEPQGQFDHAIENFLFADGDRRGYCMHFASAAALLLRLRGIPCRIGVGLYGGDPDPRNRNARMFGSQHAHAWVEVPFVGRGYMVFDPTPAAERGQRTPSRLDPTESGDDAKPDEVVAESDVFATVWEWLRQPLPLLLIGSLLLLVLTQWSRRPGVAAIGDAHTAPKGARWLLGRLLQALAAAGHRRQRGQSLEQLAGALPMPAVRTAVADAFLAYQEVRFGEQPFDGTRRSRLQQGLAVAAELTRTQLPDSG